MIREIGRGAYGRAILSKCLDDGSLKVLKEIDMSRAGRHQREGIGRELRILKSMQHSNIIAYHTHHFDNGKLYISMEYADGGDFYAKIQSQPSKLPEAQIIDWFCQMCLAVKYIHDRKIVHRDIKPSNFFLTRNGIVKLGDFGLSALLPFTTALLASSVGTPHYLSPELCRGSKYDSKSDIWALGCVLYEMCALRRAFDGVSMKHLMLRIQLGKAPRLPTRYSGELRTMHSMMLAKDPHKRPTINQLLSLPALRYKAVALLGKTQARHELAHSVFHGFAACRSPEGFAAPVVVLDADDADDSDRIEFCGRTLVLPRLGAQASHQARAEALRVFIEELIGVHRFSEIYTALTENDIDMTNRQIVSAADQWIAQLILRLIACEEVISRANSE
jgi:NIMA (never in mitosis gene a)-related kinase